MKRPIYAALDLHSRHIHVGNFHLSEMANVPRQFANLSLRISANVGCPISFSS